MKQFVLSLFMIGVSLGVFAKDDDQNCKQAVLPFLLTFEGYCLSDYCKFSEFLSYDFGDFILERKGASHPVRPIRSF